VKPAPFLGPAPALSKKIRLQTLLIPVIGEFFLRKCCSYVELGFIYSFSHPKWQMIVPYHNIGTGNIVNEFLYQTQAKTGSKNRLQPAPQQC